MNKKMQTFCQILQYKINKNNRIIFIKKDQEVQWDFWNEIHQYELNFISTIPFTPENREKTPEKPKNCEKNPEKLEEPTFMAIFTEIESFFYSFINYHQPKLQTLPQTSPKTSSQAFQQASPQAFQQASPQALPQASQQASPKPLIRSLFYTYIAQSNEKSKFEYLYSTLNNPFINESTKNEFLDIFSSTQSIYYKISQWIRKKKQKKQSYQITTDMYLNPVEPTDKYIMTISQNNKKYLFSIIDLVNITNTALGNTMQYFAEPLIIKNPYTNIPFDKSTLYNIYFFMKQCSFNIPPLYYFYFLSNFDLCVFREKYESIIRNYAIEKYIENSPMDTLHTEIKSMIRNSRYNYAIRISKEFPKKKLVEIMRPYLKIYLFANYSLEASRRYEHMEEFENKMDRFIQYNPNFGRKKIVNRVVTFSDDCVLFYNAKHEIKKFMNSHLSADAEVYPEGEGEGEEEDPFYQHNIHHRFVYNENVDDNDVYNDDDDDESD